MKNYTQVYVKNSFEAAETYCNACAFHSRVTYNLLQIVAEKNLVLHQRAMITARRTTREKLMTYLLLQAKEAGRAEFSIPFDRQELADYLEVDRSGLSAEMSKLKRQGVLDYYKSDFRLLRMPKDEWRQTNEYHADIL